MNNTLKLKKLVIKPTLLCNGNCKTCSYRKSLHHKLRKETWLTLKDWEKVLADASELGVKILGISGGEPTLCKFLPELVRTGKNYHWKVKMNSNGGIITEDYAEKLVNYGLDEVKISLYSPNPEINDNMRGSIGMWKRTVSAIRIWAKMQKKYPNFKLTTQTLICRENYLDLPRLIQLHRELGSVRVDISYLEGDFEKKNLLNAQEIITFKEKIIPKLIKYCQNFDTRIRGTALTKIDTLYSEKLRSIAQWEKGVYQSFTNGSSTCKTSQSFAMILANGDILPCQIVEYTHQPVMGNIKSKKLSEVWRNKKWVLYRKQGHEKCSLCPIHLHISLPLQYIPKYSGVIDIAYWKLKEMYHSKLFKKIKSIFIE